MSRSATRPRWPISAASGTGEDERRLAWIVETAEVIEAPIYLQITRELKVKGLLEPTSAGQHGVVDTRGVDRSKLRLSLLETWERALIAGHLREEVPLNRAERHAAIEHLSALACVGLKLDRLEVEFDDHRDEALADEVRARLAAIDSRRARRPACTTSTSGLPPPGQHSSTSSSCAGTASGSRTA